jgi:hypothetical protein
MQTLIAGGAYFVFVFFKAFQQRNVAFNHYKWVIPLSYLMSAAEVGVIALVSVDAMNAHTWTDMLPIIGGVGTGGGLGAVASMWLHNRWLGDST